MPEFNRKTFDVFRQSLEDRGIDRVAGASPLPPSSAVPLAPGPGASPEAEGTVLQPIFTYVWCAPNLAAVS